MKRLRFLAAFLFGFVRAWTAKQYRRMCWRRDFEAALQRAGI